jgi:hypothetical protein
MGKVPSPGLSTESLPSSKKKNRRKAKVQRDPATGKIENQTAKKPDLNKPRKEVYMTFGTAELPAITEYYQSHRGLSIHGRLSPLFHYPIEVLANCRKHHFSGREIWGSGKGILNIVPPPRTPELSLHEWYTLWAEDLRICCSRRLAADPFGDKEARRYRRNLEVLEFMRATWDALLAGYQVERALHLTRYGCYSPLNSRRLQGVDRFRKQLVYHPLEAAQRVKTLATENRAWFFGGPKPTGRLLVFPERKTAMLMSYIARALPPAPRNPEGLKGLFERLTSEPPPEPKYWRPFVKAYIERWAPVRRPPDLFTMPSANAALGYPRHTGGHVTGVQHLVLLGWALTKVHGVQEHPSMKDDSTGAYLELLSDALHPSSQLRPGKVDFASLFRQPWDELEKSLPGAGHYLQNYLRRGVFYVLDNIDFTPILPIVAEERGLKTRFPTCSLTAVNLVQQVLRRVIDHVMINDPRFSRALGADHGIDLSGELGSWYSQDATAATDYHPKWLTQGVYEELADKYPQLAPYRKYFDLLFGTKRLLNETNGAGELHGSEFYAPVQLLEQYPRAPLLDDRFVDRSKLEAEYGHAANIIEIFNDWLGWLCKRDGVMTTTGQMMGDPTSFPPLMLSSLCAAEQTLAECPYTPKERRRRHRGLKPDDAVLEGVGDDALFPRWNALRASIYQPKLGELGGVISVKKTFLHLSRGLIAEVPTIGGKPMEFWPLSVLVAPPGGSKGHVTWFSQIEAFGNDPTRPIRRIPKFFWRLSPYWYTWMLARRLGLPVAAPVAYGGIGLPTHPPVALLGHAQWLSFLSQASLEDLVVGLGIGPLGHSNQGLLDFAARGWLKEVLAARDQWSREGLELLSDCALSDTAEMRVSLEEGFRMAVGRLRSVEFYFRAPPESLDHHAPSVRMSAQRFERKVSHTRVVPTNGYAATKRDLERKLNVFFSTSGGYLPDPAAKKPGLYGLEESGLVRTRWKAPWLRGVG